MRRSPVVLSALLALPLLGVGCAVGGPPEPGAPAPADTAGVPGGPIGPFEDEADYRRQRAQTAAALEASVAPAEASAIGACRVAPTSEQACGGPTSFAVYSAEDPDAAETERLASRLVALDVQANAQFERVSTCVAHAPPRPVLRGGRCLPAE